jgi:glycosyltransferase involved in cell wall biosynthesis
VQTHFNAVAKFAEADGCSVVIADPYHSSGLPGKVSRGVGRLIAKLDRELSVLWNRYFDRLYLGKRLRDLLGEDSSASTVVYAQDPLSASAALDLRRQGLSFRLAAVMHFNVSEGYECVVSGIAREGGILWNNHMSRERSVLPQLDAIIFVSEFMRQVILGRTPLDGVEQHVLANFPSDPDPVRGDANFVLGDLISIGTLEPRKNQGFLLDVLFSARKLGYEYRLTLVGDGPCRQALEQRAHDLGVADLVTFAGYVGDASRLIAQHRAYVHAARMESFGLVIVEALSYGRPVLAPEVGGIAEIIKHGREGYFWSLDNPDLAARLLVDVLESPIKYEHMSNAARHRFNATYKADLLGPKWLAALTGNKFDRVGLEQEIF